MESGGQRATADRRAIQSKVDEIRSANFKLARRGFDRDEVGAYLTRLARWLQRSGLVDPDQVNRELTLVGERTSEILTKANETARELRAKAEREAGETVHSASAEAERIRAEAQEEGRRVRLEADSRAEGMVREAERRAQEMIDEAARRRGALETVIDDLVGRRDEIVAEARGLVDELGGVLDRGLEDPRDPTVEPAEIEERPEADTEVVEGEIEADTEQQTAGGA
jgi:DivIVA domain-containing protein